ncbi:hypothetical protein THF1C08_110024 [Vibrio jasicida]|uniref:Uncharacterized protein n=1 Tax=Vibrio jasicida TaxID=766224 RepID=A0AAU9QEQ7_9VIBR|nr:hypothetical protein THF1C08_110024 [Vibrio jasicida]CAH1568453.1 hypothetical protein THF1A12_100025 [Vibrio jasicida]
MIKKTLLSVIRLPWNFANSPVSDGDVYSIGLVYLSFPSLRGA